VLSSDCIRNAPENAKNLRVEDVRALTGAARPEFWLDLESRHEAGRGTRLKERKAASRHIDKTSANGCREGQRCFLLFCPQHV